MSFIIIIFPLSSGSPEVEHLHPLGCGDGGQAGLGEVDLISFFISLLFCAEFTVVIIGGHGF